MPEPIRAKVERAKAREDTDPVSRGGSHQLLLLPESARHAASRDDFLLLPRTDPEAPSIHNEQTNCNLFSTDGTTSIVQGPRYYNGSFGVSQASRR